MSFEKANIVIISIYLQDWIFYIFKLLSETYWFLYISKIKFNKAIDLILKWCLNLGLPK